MFLQTDPRIPLESIAGMYVAQTSDLGVEVGIPGFRVRSLASLLPDWATRDEELAALDNLPVQVLIHGPDAEVEGLTPDMVKDVLRCMGLGDDDRRARTFCTMRLPTNHQECQQQ